MSMNLQRILMNHTHMIRNISMILGQVKYHYSTFYLPNSFSMIPPPTTLSSL
jgi:hypothetical protein